MHYYIGVVMQWGKSCINVFVHLGLLVGSLKWIESLLEVKQLLVLLMKPLSHVAHLGLELQHARSQCHRCDLLGQIELLVWIHGNHREYLIRKPKTQAHHNQSPSSTALQHTWSFLPTLYLPFSLILYFYVFCIFGGEKHKSDVKSHI